MLSLLEWLVLVALMILAGGVTVAITLRLGYRGRRWAMIPAVLAIVGTGTLSYCVLTGVSAAGTLVLLILSLIVPVGIIALSARRSPA